LPQRLLERHGIVGSSGVWRNVDRPQRNDPGFEAPRDDDVDLFEDPAKVEAVKADYKSHRGDAPYKALIPDGPPPLKQAWSKANSLLRQGHAKETKDTPRLALPLRILPSLSVSFAKPSTQILKNPPGSLLPTETPGMKS